MYFCYKFIITTKIAINIEKNLKISPKSELSQGIQNFPIKNLISNIDTIKTAEPNEYSLMSLAIFSNFY